MLTETLRLQSQLAVWNHMVRCHGCGIASTISASWKCCVGAISCPRSSSHNRWVTKLVNRCSPKIWSCSFPTSRHLWKGSLYLFVPRFNLQFISFTPCFVGKNQLAFARAKSGVTPFTKIAAIFVARFFSWQENLLLTGHWCPQVPGQHQMSVMQSL